jgi:hypothetical protein
MENNTCPKTLISQFVPRKSFRRWKEKPFHTKDYLDFLAHYDAELVLNDGPIRVVRCKTGIELPLEQKAKLLMVKLLLDEFGTIDGANKAIENCKASQA